MNIIKHLPCILIFLLLVHNTKVYGQFVGSQPNNNTPVKFMKINIHVMRNDEGLDGIDDIDGPNKIRELIRKANDQIANFKQPSWSSSATVPVPLIPSKYRYVITPSPNDPNDPDHDGIYFHNDSRYNMMGSFLNEALGQYIDKITGSASLNYNRLNDFVSLYRSQDEHVYHVYILVDYGRRNNASESFRYGHGTALSIYSENFIMAIRLEDDITDSYGLLNHEMGHCLGLLHPDEDECSDTGGPIGGINGASECMKISTVPGCSSPHQVGNNLMNSGYPKEESLTPCQLGKIHNTLNSSPWSNFIANSYNSSCQVYPNYNFSGTNHINQSLSGNSVEISNSIDFIQNNNIDLGASLIISLKPGFSSVPSVGKKFTAKIINSCTLTLLNTNESTWTSSEQALFGTRNNSGARIETTESNSFECLDSYNNSARIEHYERTIDSNLSIGLFPNPNAGTFTITFPDATASYCVELVDVLGNKIYTEQIADTSSKELAVANLPSGLYIVNVTGGGITYRDKIQVIK